MHSCDVTIRTTTKDDIETIMSFIQKKAEFDFTTRGFGSSLEVSQDRLLNTLFNDSPYANAIFAELNETICGFAMYHFRYSSFMGLPYLWLDDLLVNANTRSKGIGKKLMQSLATQALDKNCSHMAWTASTKNLKGLQFYARLGAKRQDDNGKLITFRLDCSGFLALGNSSR